jgi:tetratricopeptide (TPR) repeat protein
MKNAIKDYSQAINYKPDFANAYYHRGLAHDRLWDHQAAFADWEMALKISPDHELARQKIDDIPF